MKLSPHLVRICEKMDDRQDCSLPVNYGVIGRLVNDYDSGQQVCFFSKLIRTADDMNEKHHNK